jgi:glycosyltransferase involved in cell wall biosynthesis
MDSPAGAAVAAPPSDAYLFVLMWEPHHVGGVNVVVKNLAATVQRATNLRPLIGIGDWSATRPVQTADGLHLRFAVTGQLTPIGLVKSLLRLPSRLLTIHRFLRSNRVAVANFHYFSVDALGVALLKWLRLYRGKLVISIHGSDVRPAGGRIEAWLRAAIFGTTDAVVAVSEGLATRATSALRLQRKRISVVYNGVDHGVFRPDAAELPGPVDQIVGRMLVSIGRYDPMKGQMCLLDAFARLAADYPDVQLCMAGDAGEELSTLRLEAERRGVSARVHLLSFLPPQQVAALLARATLCVQPSRAEGLGLTLLEAGATGTPLVVSDIAGHDELVEHGVSGLRFPVGDAQACALAIASLLDDAPRAQRMAQTQRRRNLGAFTWTNCLAGYLAALGLGHHLRTLV